MLYAITLLFLSILRQGVTREKLLQDFTKSHLSFLLLCLRILGKNLSHSLVPVKKHFSFKLAFEFFCSPSRCWFQKTQIVGICHLRAWERLASFHNGLYKAILLFKGGGKPYIPLKKYDSVWRRLPALILNHSYSEYKPARPCKCFLLSKYCVPFNSTLHWGQKGRAGEKSSPDAFFAKISMCGSYGSTADFTQLLLKSWLLSQPKLA